MAIVWARFRHERDTHVPTKMRKGDFTCSPTLCQNDRPSKSGNQGWLLVQKLCEDNFSWVCKIRRRAK